MVKNNKKLCDIPPVHIYPIQLLEFIANWQIRTPKKVSPLLWVGAINKMLQESMDAGGFVSLMARLMAEKEERWRS